MLPRCIFQNYLVPRTRSCTYKEMSKLISKFLVKAFSRRGHSALVPSKSKIYKIIPTYPKSINLAREACSSAAKGHVAGLLRVLISFFILFFINLNFWIWHPARVLRWQTKLNCKLRNRKQTNRILREPYEGTK